MKKLLLLSLLFWTVFVHAQTGGTCPDSLSCIKANQISTNTTLYGDTLGNLGVNYDTLPTLITIYRIAGIDSLYLSVNGIITPVKDSIGGGGSGGLDSSTVNNLISSQLSDSNYIPFKDTGIYIVSKHSFTKSIDSIAAFFNNYLLLADTATMLVPYLLSSDTTGRWQPQGNYIYFNDTGLYVASQHAFTKSIDSLAALLTGGTVTSIATTNGILGGTITSSGTLQADTTLLATQNYVSRQGYITTAVTSIATSSGITGGTITTTGTLKADTSLLATENYVGRQGFGTGTVTSVSAGLGMNFTTITGSGSIILDTTRHATSSQTGLLDNLDWTTFNNKGSGSVTSIATTSGITGGTITTTGTLKADTSLLATENYVQRQGYITGNQPITLTGNVTGSGTTSIATTIAATTNSTLATLTALSLPSSQVTGGFLDNTILAYQALGSTIKAQTVGCTLENLSTYTSTAPGYVEFAAVYLPFQATITGVAFLQGASATFTAGAGNGIGLYSISGATLTLVDSFIGSSVFKGSANQLTKQAFTAPYVASAGIYYVALSIQGSGGSNPGIGYIQMIGSALAADFTTHVLLYGQVNIASMPGTQAMSSFVSPTTTGNYVPWVGIY